MQSFKDYLHKKNHKPTTIKGELQNLTRLEKWAAQAGYTGIKELNYREILHYMQTEKSRGLSKQTINIHLNTLTKYYDYLKQQEEREDNPASQLRIKNKGNRLRTDRLSMQQLDELYKAFKSKEKFKEPRFKLTHQRNTVLLSLMIHQAAGTAEIKPLETTHINLDQGTIYIPSGTKSNARELKLQTSQIMGLFEYLTKTREKLKQWQATDENHPDKLFEGHTRNIINHLMRSLQQINPYVKNAPQIRSSVIMEWVKHHNIRKVQYMAGHRKISSTEKYRQEDIESLQKDLNKLHPLA